MGQDVCVLPAISIDIILFEAVSNFMYLGSTIASNLSLIIEIDSQITKAAAVMSRLCKRVWNNSQLTVNTKPKLYQACVLSIFLYGAESWTTYTRQEKWLETFNLHCLQCILSIQLQGSHQHRGSRMSMFT